MVELAIADFDDFSASRLELDRPGKSYTVETLQTLHQTHPDAEFFFIIGADNAAQMDTWHDPDGILAQCTVVAGSRATDQTDGDPRLVERLRFIDTPIIEFSSTQIRKRLAQGLPVRYMIPEAVEAHIRAKGLYTESCS